MKKLLLAAILALGVSPAWAQNPQCPTRPFGDSTNACASTAFVQNAATLPAIPINAICDDATDNTAVFTAAIAAAPSTGARWILPRGICRLTTLNINKPGILEGQGSGRMTAGTAPTELKITAANGVILVSQSGVGIRDLIVTSSVVASSRSDAGIRLTGAQRLILTNVASNGHAFGFWMQQGNVRFQNTFATANNLQGYYFDGTSGSGLGEFKLFDTWATSNGANGFLFEAAAGSGIAGVTMVGPVSDSNTGAGIKFTAAGGNTVADVYMSHSEVSGNAGNGVDILSCANCINFSIMAGLIEAAGATYGVAVGQSVLQTSIGDGVDIHGFGTGILLNGTGGFLGGAVLSGNTTADVELGANSSSYVMVGTKNTTAFGASAVGLKITAGAGSTLIAGADLSSATTALSGTFPAGSRVFGFGFGLTLTNGITASGAITATGTITGVQQIGKLDINGVTNFQVVAEGASNTNQQVWFGYDTTNDRGFMQAIKQGTGNKPLMLNPLGGNVVVGAAGNGAFTLDVTGTFGLSGIGTFSSATAATSTGTGAVVLNGAGAGIGVAGAGWFGTYINVVPTVVNSLPSCVAGLDGARAFVTNNATATAFGGAVTTGGANHHPVYCDGAATAWKQG